MLIVSNSQCRSSGLQRSPCLGLGLEGQVLGLGLEGLVHVNISVEKFETAQNFKQC